MLRSFHHNLFSVEKKSSRLYEKQQFFLVCVSRAGKLHMKIREWAKQVLQKSEKKQTHLRIMTRMGCDYVQHNIKWSSNVCLL